MGGEMMKRFLRVSLVILMAGSLVSYTQAVLAQSPVREEAGLEETCFADPGMVDLSEAALGSASAAMAAGDTLQTYEVELEDEGDKGINWKAVVGFTIAAAFVAYALYILLVPEDEEEEVEPPGKEPPVLVRIPF
jgi:hypothetical protein